MTIGERIRNRRKELNMTQDELAKKAGYKSRSSINKIELSRDLPLKKISQVAKALEISPSQLAGWEDTANGIIVDNTPYRAASTINSEVANKFLSMSLVGEINPTPFELDMILAYRKLDGFDRVNVLRALHMDEAAEKEKKVHAS